MTLGGKEVKVYWHEMYKIPLVGIPCNRKDPPLYNVFLSLKAALILANNGEPCEM